VTIINFLNEEGYNDSLELFFKRGLRAYVKKDLNYTLVENGTHGDVILDLKCRFVEQVQKMNGVKVLYFQESLNRFGELFENCEQHYDLIFFPETNAKTDNKRYFHLPLAYDPYTHFPLEREKTIDIAFVGTRHIDRGWIAKIPGIKIYGNEWGDEIYPVYGLKKRNIYARTKIMVDHHAGGSTFSERAFECLAMKTFLLSDLVPEEFEGGMVKYTSFGDLLIKCKYYLEHEDEREAIAVKGSALVKPYTFEARMAQMLEVVGNAERAH
jgi:spore maturation protein CgeB